LSEWIDAEKSVVLHQRPEHVFSPITRATVKKYYKLSSAQKRLYFLYAVDNNMIAYNISHVIRLKGDLNIDRLCETFKKLITRHESLRTSFVEIDGEPVQKVSEYINFHVDRFTANEVNLSQIINQFIRPFNLGESPLLRAGVIELTQEEHVLMIDMPHIISDGVSGSILVKEFTALYKDEPLEPLKLQYKDFSEWEQSNDFQLRMARHKRFWLDDFSDTIAVLELPTDFTRPLERKYEGGCLDISIGMEDVYKLKKIGEEAGCTLFIVLLSVYYVLLSKMSGQGDIVIGINTTGRQHADVENVIGLFVNTIPVRTIEKEQINFSELLASIRSKVISCLDHQSYPYEQLLSELNLDRQSGHNPLFDVMFVYQNFQDEQLDIPGLTPIPYDAVNKTAKFDLTLTVVEGSNSIHLYFEYAASLFKETTINGLMGHFKKILESVTTDVHQKILDITL
jgi:Condensation domain